MMIRVFIFVLVLMILLEGNSIVLAGNQSVEIPNVIILMMSGVRNSESILDPTHQYMSNLWNEMGNKGVFYTNLLTMDQEFHAPAASSVVNGKNAMGYFNIQAPTIFQYLRKKYAWSADQTWVIGRWTSGEGQAYYTTGKLGVDTYPNEFPIKMILPDGIKGMLSKPQEYFVNTFSRSQNGDANLSIAVCVWDSITEQTFLFFKNIIKSKKPKIVEYILNAPETAHYDTFARYVLSLKRVDEIIYEIWQMIQNDPFYKNHTYLIVCPDHERDAYYMEHGQNTYNNRSKTWMYIYGPDIKKGAIIDRRVYHVDVFATVARIMNVETHKTSGKVLEDGFINAFEKNVR